MAPEVDLFGEITYIATYFAMRHGDRIASDVGIDPRTQQVDLAGLRASLGIADDRPAITMRELEERRRIIRERMDAHRRRGPR
ncbi:MAG: hypothetical protein KY439_09070 [Actinobacteria bacterium]|nr:hypothetical protein [Actinomycetota bacterium]